MMEKHSRNQMDMLVELSENFENFEKFWTESHLVEKSEQSNVLYKNRTNISENSNFLRNPKMTQGI